MTCAAVLPKRLPLEELLAIRRKSGRNWQRYVTKPLKS